jgi:hypothetical protein
MMEREVLAEFEALEAVDGDVSGRGHTLDHAHVKQQTVSAQPAELAVNGRR